MIGPLEIGFGFALLRPLALLALLPFGLWLVLRRRSPVADGGPWRDVIDPHLLLQLLPAAPEKNRAARWLAPLFVLLAILALAGPAVHDATSQARLLRPATTRLLLVDLSPAFAALPAERQTLARRKLHALLDELPPAETALAVHAAEAYLVAPPTTDAATLARWLPELDSAAIPPAQQRADADGLRAAAQLAMEVLTRAQSARSELIWASARSQGELEAALDGAALPANTVSKVLLLTASDGEQVSPARADASRTTVILRADEHDLTALRVAFANGPRAASRLDASLTVATDDQPWRDLGPLLLPALLALAALVLWQRGALLFAAALLLLPTPPPARAESRDDPRWQAVAHYRAGDLARAAGLLEPFDDADSLYNRGNALARLGRLAEALGLYDAALAKRPGDADFRHNRDLVAKLLQSPPPKPPSAKPPPPTESAAQQEAQRAAEQWLRRVPDTPPGGDSLLKRKLAIEAERRASFETSGSRR